MFNKNTYLIKEHVAFLKLTDKYDIIDPETNTVIAYAKENISGFKKFLRLLLKKALMGTKVEIKNALDNTVEYTLIKKVNFLRPKVHIYDKNDKEIGFFKSRIFTLGGRFDVFKADGTKVADVKGNWTGWNFKFQDTNGNEIGTVSKKWTGIGKEFFTNADSYVVAIHESQQGKQEIMSLLIMAGLAIDVVYREKQ